MMKQNLRRLGSKVISKFGYRITRLESPEPDMSCVGEIFRDSLILCNFCGTIFRQSGPAHSESLSCPYCDTIARERVVYQCLLQEVNRKFGISSPIFKNTKELGNLSLLECSPRFNENRMQIYLDTLRNYLASDYDMSAHRANIRLDLTDLRDVTLYQNNFDVIICAHVLEHIADYKTALINIHKLLAPGGFLILQVPLLECQYEPAMKEEFHADYSRVYHRFSFDLLVELEKVFNSAKIIIGQINFQITSPEIHPAKYDFLQNLNEKYLVLGENQMRLSGLGIPDLCDAFVAYK